MVAGLLLAGGSVLAQPFGLTNRLANTTLALPQAAPGYLYTVTNAFPGVLITNPMAIAAPPGETNRIFIVERAGRIVVITNLAAPTRTVFLDLTSRGIQTSGESGTLGLAFHPNYASNRYFFVFYTLNSYTTAQGTGRHQRVSRFQANVANPNSASLASEVVLFTQFDEAGNHNGGDLHFGPDGYLYISLGDEGNQDDSLNNSQTIRKDFFAGILRIDPDKRPGNVPPNFHPAQEGQTNYWVPADNPWVSVPLPGETNSTGNARTEFFAVGLRNPWRMSFDPVTGWLWVGDVGGGQREEINIVTNGGNYGWAYREGFLTGPKAALSNNFPGAILTNPIRDYARGTTATNTGNSITGGLVYRGTNLPALTGAYIYADYVSGNVWALRYNGTNVTDFQLLFQDTGIVAFGRDPANGDVLLCDISPSAVKRLILNPDYEGVFPPVFLTQVGAFTNLSTLTPHAGIVPYTINVPFWSDNALKRRWFSLPNTNAKITFTPQGNWSFPTGAVWIKHFDLVTNEATGQGRRLETRFLVKNNDGVYGLTYRWGTSTTQATLVEQNGLDETITIWNSSGVTRNQVWRYPSRAECLICHTPEGGFALGFNTPQMNCLNTYTNFHGATGVTDNQLRALNHVGYFNPAVSNLHLLPALAHWTNTAYSLEYRVRSYLQANCAHCHQPGGTGLGNFDARITTPLSQAGLVNGPLNNNLGNPNARVIVPGSTANSMLHARINTLGSNRMPPLASSVIDSNNVALVAAWINSAALVNYQTFAQWQVTHFGATNAPLAAPHLDADGDGLDNYHEWLVGTVPTNSLSDWRVTIERSGDATLIQFPHVANRAFEVQYGVGDDALSLWQPLNVPGNNPFPAATTFPATITDPTPGLTNRNYRVRVIEP
jgi:uncharacterized repeat protein (TIGR03806 family)